MVHQRPDRTVYAGNLDDSLDEDSLRMFFEACGAVESITISGKPGFRYAFVEFRDAATVEVALQLSLTPVLGKPMHITKPKPQAPGVKLPKPDLVGAGKVKLVLKKSQLLLLEAGTDECEVMIRTCSLLSGAVITMPGADGATAAILQGGLNEIENAVHLLTLMLEIKRANFVKGAVEIEGRHTVQLAIPPHHVDYLFSLGLDAQANIVMSYMGDMFGEECIVNCTGPAHLLARGVRFVEQALEPEVVQSIVSTPGAGKREEDGGPPNGRTQHHTLLLPKIMIQYRMLVKDDHTEAVLGPNQANIKKTDKSSRDQHHGSKT